MIRKLFPLWGAEGDDDDPEVEETSTTDESRSITTSELEQMTARAADKASRKARREIASDLGFDSLVELKEYVSTVKKAEVEAQDEQTKALQEAERSRKEFEAKMADLTEQRLNLLITQKVVGAGVGDPKRSSRIAALVRDDLDPEVFVEEDAWDEAVTAALQAVKADMPELFAKSGVGSGDGGAHGKSTDETDESAEKEKQLTTHYLNRGMVEYPG